VKSRETLKGLLNGGNGGNKHNYNNLDAREREAAADLGARQSDLGMMYRLTHDVFIAPTCERREIAKGAATCHPLIAAINHPTALALAGPIKHETTVTGTASSGIGNRLRRRQLRLTRSLRLWQTYRRNINIGIR
jgi:hypothetical protein